MKKSKPIAYGILTLLSARQERLVELTDEEGNFTFGKVRPDTYTITFSAIGYRDTSFTNIAVNGDTTIGLDYLMYCQYDSSINNKTCPICHKRNAVIPIIYGLPYSKHGKDPTKDAGKKYILAGCEITGCDPHWYCKRDKTSF